MEIAITHCGICASDLHLAKAEWGPFSAFPKPQVSGHEIVGTVAAVGPAVKHLKPGMRVGVGWYKDSCRTCKLCMGGRESTCSASVATAAGGNNGGFAEAIRVPAPCELMGFASVACATVVTCAVYPWLCQLGCTPPCLPRVSHFHFVITSTADAFPIPEGLASEHAAPLFCGGITVYSPLVDHEAVGKRVGIAGIGGLGSMAIQFARCVHTDTCAVMHQSPCSTHRLPSSLFLPTLPPHAHLPVLCTCSARGNYTVGLSTSADKEAMAKGLGAHAFVNMKDEAAVKAAENSLDLIIVTFNVAVDFAPYFAMLAPHGRLVFVGAIIGDVKLPIFGPLIMKQLTVAGSVTGGRARIAEMLDFAAAHGVKPQVEVFPFTAESVTEACERVEANKIRFRAVLKW